MIIRFIANIATKVRLFYVITKKLLAFFRKPTSPPLNLKFFLKSTRPSFFDKAGCTRQFESELSLRSFAPLFPIKEGAFENPPVLPYP